MTADMSERTMRRREVASRVWHRIDPPRPGGNRLYRSAQLRQAYRTLDTPRPDTAAGHDVYAVRAVNAKCGEETLYFGRTA